MHGRDIVIEELDSERGSVSISLTDACDGCLVAPTTIQAIQTRMSRDIPELTTVHVEMGRNLTPDGKESAGDEPSGEDKLLTSAFTRLRTKIVRVFGL